MNNSCVHCGNTSLCQKTTRYFHEQGDALLIVNAVPCLVCERCGEAFFEATVLKQIEAEHLAIIQHQKKPTAVWEVPIADFESPRAHQTA